MSLKTFAAACALAAAAAVPTTAQAAYPGGDGLLAVAETDAETNDSSIVLLDSATGAVAGTVDRRGGQETSPAFDPTGQRLAYVRVTEVAPDESGEVQRRFEIREVSLADPSADRSVWQAPDSIVSVRDLDYTPDGARLVFSYLQRTPDSDEPLLGSVRTDGMGLQPLMRGVFNAVAVNAAGTFALNNDDPGGTIYRPTGDPEVRAAVPVSPAPRSSRVLDVRADGGGLLYRGAGGTCQTLHQAPVTGGTGIPVVSACGDVTFLEVAGSPRGGRAALAVLEFPNPEAETPSYAVDVADLATGARTRISSDRGTITGLDWQPLPRAATTLVAEPSVLKLLSPTGTSVNLRVQARLTRGSTPVAGERITFRNGAGEVLCSATTASTGVASCTGLAPLLNHLLGLGYTASFGGSQTLSPSSGKAPIVQVLTLKLL